jgi:hypothetical protein
MAELRYSVRDETMSPLDLFLATCVAIFAFQGL